MAAAFVPMSAVFCAVVSRGVYAVRTVANCPALMPWSSMTGGSVTPSSRIRPVRVDGNKDIFTLVQDTDPAAREGDYLHAD